MALLDGGIAQLGEHLLCKQGVNGSIPFVSTSFFSLEVFSSRFWLKAVLTETVFKQNL